MSLSAASNSAELSKTLDCTVIELEPEVDSTLTTQENIQRLTEQFFESVNTVQHCDPPDDSSASGGGAGGSGGVAAAASSDISGTEALLLEQSQAPAESLSDSELSAIQSDINEALGSSSGSDAKEIEGSESTEAKDENNGALPDDIPPTNNDSVFEAQIRTAAENEPNPEVKKKLWNEYRKYKGLSIKD